MKKKNLLQRVIIITIVTLVGLYLVIGPRRKPRFSDFTWSGIKATLASNIRLGLDLKGGSHLVMRVKTEQYLAELTKGNALAIQSAAQGAGLPVTAVKSETAGNYRIILETTDASKLKDIEEAAKKKVDMTDWSMSTSGNTMSWTLTSAAQILLAEQATEQAQRIIDSRLNALAVAEPLIQRHGAQSSHQILVQMPGIDNPQRVKDLLKGTSKLELVRVVGPSSPVPHATYVTEQEAKDSLGGTVPANRRILPYTPRDEPTTAGSQTPPAEKQKQWVVVEMPAVVDGSELRNASAVQSGAGSSDYQISFALKPGG